MGRRKVKISEWFWERLAYRREQGTKHAASELIKRTTKVDVVFLKCLSKPYLNHPKVRVNITAVMCMRSVVSGSVEIIF